MISDTLYNQLDKLIESKGIGLYGIDFLKDDATRILRISIYKKNGITLDDCETISNLISPLLDVELQDEDAYHLEVSSPGVERVLKEPKHFFYSIGENIEIYLFNKQIIRGILKEYCPANQDSDSYIVIDVTDSKNKRYPKGLQSIILRDCKKVKTFFVWNKH
ncbi:ribosome maturation factor RimP [Helicobacter aurati]|uniref:Ribosome maturation factor RimP n=1 Tax=Helicobacter aurati TaxID=137778 RepID=A0A3D8J7D7_9HELI|nr:ribosome maturation factor RimP [Helicobacter aurati]RDU73338.1 ribosome maturation factor RimP [Helicobacter aurati]